MEITAGVVMNIYLDKLFPFVKSKDQVENRILQSATNSQYKNATH
jgi:hypothetical protein